MHNENKTMGYIIPSKAWYAQTNPIDFSNRMTIASFCDDGGVYGEFQLIWNEYGIQLKAYDDAWNILCNCPKLLKLMDKIGKTKETPTMSQFAEMLQKIGYKDKTEYTMK